jgi:hypothetical protein
MRNYITKISKQDFEKLYPEISLPSEAEFPVCVSLHTNYPTDTYFSKELGTKPFFLASSVEHIYSSRRYWEIRRLFNLFSSDKPLIKIPKAETEAIYLVMLDTLGDISEPDEETSDNYYLHDKGD